MDVCRKDEGEMPKKKERNLRKFQCVASSIHMMRL